MVNLKRIRICIFIHYSVSDSIPYYVQIYINELSLHFDKVKVLTNNPKINSKNNSLNKNISFEYFENRGYDFGMFYRYIIQQDLNNYSELAIINDSNVLLNKLDKVFESGRKSESDFWGIIDSNEKPWFSSHKDNYHIQSHFIVLNRRAIKLLPSFFNSLNINNIMNEKDNKQLKRLIINDWEIGFTQYLLNHKLSSYSFIENEKIRFKYKIKQHNLTHLNFSVLLSGEGYPLLKTNEVKRSKKRKLFRKRFPLKTEMIKYIYRDWDINKLFE